MKWFSQLERGITPPLILSSDRGLSVRPIWPILQHRHPFDRCIPFLYCPFPGLCLDIRCCNATCFSLFLDVGMAYILGALESPNSGAQKCIGKWLRENDSFKKYRTFCILFAIIGSFCFVLPHSCLQSICRTQCQLLNAFLISSIQHPRPELTALQ